MKPWITVLALAACSQGSSETPATPLATAPSTHGPVIATLATHDGKISIVGHGSASRDLRVVVRRSDGTVVADGIPLAELERRDPASWALVRNATVGLGDGTYLDATGPTGARARTDATLDVR